MYSILSLNWDSWNHHPLKMLVLHVRNGDNSSFTWFMVLGSPLADGWFMIFTEIQAVLICWSSSDMTKFYDTIWVDLSRWRTTCYGTNLLELWCIQYKHAYLAYRAPIGDFHVINNSGTFQSRINVFRINMNNTTTDNIGLHINNLSLICLACIAL